MLEAELKTTKTIKFNVDIGNQVEDGLFTGQDLILYCKEKMKVSNSVKIAQRKINYEDNYNSVTLETDVGNLLKKI